MSYISYVYFIYYKYIYIYIYIYIYLFIYIYYIYTYIYIIYAYLPTLSIIVWSVHRYFHTGVYIFHKRINFSFKSTPVRCENIFLFCGNLGTSSKS